MARDQEFVMGQDKTSKPNTSVRSDVGDIGRDADGKTRPSVASKGARDVQDGRRAAQTGQATLIPGQDF